MLLRNSLLLFTFLFWAGCKSKTPEVPLNSLQLFSVEIGGIVLSSTNSNTDIEVSKPFVLSFSASLDTSTIISSIQILNSSDQPVNYSTDVHPDLKAFSITPDEFLAYKSDYGFIISNQLRGLKGEVFSGAQYSFTTENGILNLDSIRINNNNFQSNLTLTDVDFNIEIEAYFSEPLNETELASHFVLSGTGNTDISVVLDQSKKVATIRSLTPLGYYRNFFFSIKSSLVSDKGYSFSGFDNLFFTRLDSTYKFPEIPDEELLSKVQEQTFKYFWDFAHPVSGLARDRNTSGETVTVGGSGFGVMAILVAIERGFITREEGINRIETIVNFLKNADRFHGVWPHWMNGTTGKVIPFSADDDGGDLVETGFMIQGLLTARQYLNSGNIQEAEIITTITQLWQEVEWDWYTQGGQDVLYWHWSPNFSWQKNHQIKGWNEALIVYVLAASSPTHSISADVYHKGWAQQGNMINGSSFYGITLPLGADFGGPLFFEHYSFLGLNPSNLTDQYASYINQATNHSKINHAYCANNPRNWIGYSDVCWGLTASDNHQGYSAHSPTNDLGVITPTAAISSIPFTPIESLNALKHFYYVLGDRTWGEYGFYDAFNITEGWYASSYLAIDQGPIIIMIENYRTGLLWNLFMLSPEVQQGLDNLGFNY